MRSAAEQRRLRARGWVLLTPCLPGTTQFQSMRLTEPSGSVAGLATKPWKEESKQASHQLPNLKTATEHGSTILAVRGRSEDDGAHARGGGSCATPCAPQRGDRGRRLRTPSDEPGSGALCLSFWGKSRESSGIGNLGSSGCLPAAPVQLPLDGNAVRGPKPEVAFFFSWRGLGPSLTSPCYLSLDVFLWA